MLLCFDEFDFDPERLELRRDGLHVDADPNVLRLLAALLRDAGHVVTKKELLTRVWSGRTVCESVITVAIARLRRTLGHGIGGRQFVVNVHSRGYRFERPVVEKIERSKAVVQHWDAAATADAADLVGRQAVMARVRAALADACQGRGNICLLTGEPGIGKTRVVEQLAREAAAAGMLVAWGTCPETGDGPPLWPFQQLLDELTRASEMVQSARSWKGRMEVAGASSSSEVGVFADKSMSKHALFESIVRVFMEASRTHTCVLLLDDLHRADAASIELLRHMLDPISRTRVLLACTVRDDPVPNPDLSYVRGHRNCTRISLERLAAAAVGAYVEQQICDPDGRLAQAVFVKSEGIPFYMVELVRQLLLSERPDPQTLRVPQAALELVRPRLLALDQSLSGVLSWAAVIGARFDLGTLARVTGLSPVEVMARLDEAITRAVVRPVLSSKTTFAFGHDLYREVLYDVLPSSTRRHYHMQVAHTLEQRQTNAMMVSSAEIAYHLHAALPEGEIDKTVAACSKAADEAARLFAFADSVMHLRHALEALALRKDADPRVQMGLLLRQAYDARVSASPELESAVETLTELARRYRSAFFMVNVGILRDLHPGFPPWSSARSVLEEALSWLGPEEHELQAVTLARLSIHPPLLYDARACAAQLDKARVLSEQSGAPFARFNVLVAELYLNAKAAEGHTESDAERQFQTLCRQANQLPIAQIILDFHRVITRMQRGDLLGATAAVNRAVAIARDIGSRELLWHAERSQAHVVLNARHDEEALEALRALHRRARAHRIVATNLFMLYDEVLILGEAADTAALYRLCAPGPDDPPSVWSMKLRLLTAAGEPDAARLLLAQVPPERLVALKHDRDYPGTLGALTHAALSLSACNYLEELYPLLHACRESFAVHVSLFCEGSMDYLCGEIATTLGKDALAQQHFAADRAFLQRTGLRAGRERGPPASELFVRRWLIARKLSSN